jgi:8-oxo-dGTP pyrophosphatase MutT (NUDIX family)
MPLREEPLLTKRLAGPLPGVEAQLRMAPDYRLDRDLADVTGKRCREAAVLALLHPSPDGTSVLLIERPHTQRKHPGQIAFPGGRREPRESLQQTALRETQEEVGVPPTHIRVLGMMTPLFVPPSGYCVYPFVGAINTLPELLLQPEEVASTFSAPIKTLADPANSLRQQQLVRGLTVDVPAFACGGHLIWGATAMMLAELLDLLSAEGAGPVPAA